MTHTTDRLEFLETCLECQGNVRNFFVVLWWEPCSRKWKFREKITLSENKLWSVFVVNAVKELSEVRQARLIFSDIMLNRNCSV